MATATVAKAHIFIFNLQGYHSEIIPSVIEYAPLLFNLTNYRISLFFVENDSFRDYVTKQYPHITILNSIPTAFDYSINCTIYDHDLELLSKSPRHIAISHRVVDTLTSMPNVYFLTPLCKSPRYLNCSAQPPLKYGIDPTIPIFIIAGNVARRNLSLLKRILQETAHIPYLIRIVGDASCLDESYKQSAKLEISEDLNYQDFHAKFNGVYCIIPLIHKSTNPNYYSTTYTGSISYAYGYNIKCLLDEDLQSIYNLPNAVVFKDADDIVSAFLRVIDSWKRDRSRLRLETPRGSVFLS